MVCCTIPIEFPLAGIGLSGGFDPNDLKREVWGEDNRKQPIIDIAVSYEPVFAVAVAFIWHDSPIWIRKYKN